MKLVDTSVVIDIDRGDVEEKVRRLDDEGTHALSVVSLTELRLGVNRQYETETADRQEALAALERLCARFELLGVDRPIAVTAAAIIADLQSRGEPLDDRHAVYIAATARTNQLPVLTANVDHFERIENVQVIDWTTY